MPSYSNGAVYADFDDDGDLDIVTNNINQEAFFYENKSNNVFPENNTLKINLKGDSRNKNAVGAKCMIYTPTGTLYQEKQAVRGFLSSIEAPLHFGLGPQPKVDSIVVIWPDNSFQKINYTAQKKVLEVVYAKGLPQFNYKSLYKTKNYLNDIAAKVGLDIKHNENPHNEFDREALIPNMMSTEGPTIAVADVNNDTLEDVYIGAAKWEKPSLYLQTKNGKFTKSTQTALDADSTFEDTSAQFVDINNDGYVDLLVASGGNEFYGKSPNLAPRAYMNDGRGNFTKNAKAFENVFLTASTLVSADFNKDGYMDLFVGARTESWAYGQIPVSYLLQNKGDGTFIDVTQTKAQNLAHIGLVKGARWADYDKDNDADLVLALEWDGIVVFENTHGNFSKKVLCDKKGWWNFAEPVDIDADGDMDFVCGNLGLNARIHASDAEPVRMYVNDFDDNGRLDQIITYYLENKETVFADKREIEKQLPYVKKEFIYAKDFARASLDKIFTSGKISNAKVFEANYFSNALLLNDGKNNFQLKALPAAAQWTTYKALQILDANSDKLPDLLLMGNFYECNIQLGLFDADHGNIFLNKGKAQFDRVPINNMPIYGQFRTLKPITIGTQTNYLAASNNDKLMLFNLSPKPN